MKALTYVGLSCSYQLIADYLSVFRTLKRIVMNLPALLDTPTYAGKMLKKRSQLQSYSTWVFIARWKRWLHFVKGWFQMSNSEASWFSGLGLVSLEFGHFLGNKRRLPDESHQSQNLCSLWLQTSAMWHTTPPRKKDTIYWCTYNMFLFIQINHLHEWQKENKIKTKGPSMRTFSMPISIPWTSTTMSALQFQMIFKSNSSPSYLKPKATWQIWLQSLKTSQKRQNQASPSANYHMSMFFFFHRIRIICIHLDSMSGNWFCFPCATPISRISGCFSPKEKVLKETVPKTEGKASCHISWFIAWKVHEE